MATVPPQALGTLTFAWTWLDNTGHDVVGVIWTWIIAFRAAIRCSMPFVPAYIEVKADTVDSPVVGAASPNLREGWNREEEKGERGKDDFHRVSLNKVIDVGLL